MPMTELAREAARIAREAGDFIRAQKKPEIFQKQGDANYVTSADLATQELILGELRELLPGAHFFAEEQEENTLEPGFNWIVDPIDGTSNFMRDFRHSSVSIGLVEDGRGVLGVVHNPYLQETFVGIRGQGAWCNGERLHVSREPLEKGLVVVGTSPYYRELADATFEMMKRIFFRCMDVRRLGSAALDLCYVAAGRCAAFYEQRLCPWDFAAGSVILEEAGGTGYYIGNPGGAIDYAKPCGILAASPAVFSELKSLLEL